MRVPIARKFSRVRTPTVLQMEAVECGAASLGIILAYYGCIVPLAELRRVCGVSRDGSKASKILKAARTYGLRCEGYKKDLAQVWELEFPFIVFWNFNHFLVVEGRKKNKVFINDPATGPRCISEDEFDEGYTGVVLAMYPGPEFRKMGRPPSLVAALATRLKHSLPTLLYCILAGLMLVVPGIAPPILTQVFVDYVLVRQLRDWFLPLLIGLGFSVVLSYTLRQLQLLFLRRLKIKLAVAMAGRFIWHTLRLPVSYFAQRFAGEISSRVVLNDKVAEVLSGRLAVTAIGVITMLLYAAILLCYDAVLTLVALGFALINFLVLRLTARQRVDANIRLGMEYGKALGVSISGLQTMETLKASGLELDFFARWAGYYTRALNTSQELGLQDRLSASLPPLLSALTNAVVLSLGGMRVMQGELSLGMLIAFQSLMLQFLRPINDLVSLGNLLQELAGDLNRLDDLLGNPVEPSPEPLPSEEVRRLEGYVELRDVTFGYSPLEAPLIENLSFSLAPGQRVALVGGSGSGKSTVARLICGLYPLRSGQILFDGKPRAQIPQTVLARSIAIVDQELFMFEGTIRENLTLWDGTVTESQMIRACKDAEIHEAILQLPRAYDHLLIEGAVNLSGGQRQRLEIARALVAEPAILVLDEATSALDAEVEHQIEQNLRRRGCTCIIVAHRLSTIRNCDEILVFDRGRVVQRGSHAELIAQEGLYAQLLRSEGGGIE